jgi:hypothetical protein
MTNTHDEVLLNKLRTKKNTLLCMIQFVVHRCVLVYVMDSKNVKLNTFCASPNYQQIAVLF